MLVLRANLNLHCTAPTKIIGMYYNIMTGSSYLHKHSITTLNRSDHHDNQALQYNEYSNSNANFT